MENIVIKIPDNLSPIKEAALISKRLAQKALTTSGTSKEVLRIGNELNIKKLKTTITIERVSNEKPIQMIKCNVCGCEYQNNTSSHFYHNYGGAVKKVSTCSKECSETAIELIGNRASLKKSKIKPFNFF